MSGEEDTGPVPRVAVYHPQPVPSITERVIRSLGHAFLMIGGIYGAIGTLPKSLAFAAEPLQLAVWSAFLCTGILAGLSALMGKFLLEYALIPFMTGGVLIYTGAIWWAVVTGENPGSGVAAGLMSSLALYLVARFVSLHQLVRGPTRLLGRRVKNRFRRASEETA